MAKKKNLHQLRSTQTANKRRAKNKNQIAIWSNNVDQSENATFAWPNKATGKIKPKARKPKDQPNNLHRLPPNTKTMHSHSSNRTDYNHFIHIHMHISILYLKRVKGLSTFSILTITQSQTNLASIEN